MYNNIETGIERINAGLLLDRLGFKTKRVVIKYGGNAMMDDDLKASVAEDIVQLKEIGLQPVVVHGGGPAVSQQMDKEGLEPEFVHGQRRTDDDTLEIAEMVLSGRVNKDLVGLINEHGGKAVGISGKDGCLVRARKLKKETEIDGVLEKLDLGRVGEVREVDTTLIETLLDEDFIPVISPICAGEKEGDYNVNADILAGEIASSLNADSLVYLTNVNGIHEEKDDEDTRMKKIHVDEAESLIGKVIKGGMIPKVESAVKAVRDGVTTVRIVDGTSTHGLRRSMESETDHGTLLHSEEEE